MAFDSFGNGGGKAWQTPAPAEKPESAAAAGHSLAPTMRVGGGPTDGCSSTVTLTFLTGTGRHRVQIAHFFRGQIGSWRPLGVGLVVGKRLYRIRHRCSSLVLPESPGSKPWPIIATYLTTYATAGT